MDTPRARPLFSRDFQELPVFSPSQVQTYAYCPKAWRLGQIGVTPKVLTKKHLYGIIGKAAAVGFEVLNQLEREKKDDRSMAISFAEKDFHEQVQRLEKFGCRFPLNFRDTGEADVRKAVRLIHADDPYRHLPIRNIETFLPGSRSIPDVVRIYDDKTLLPIDYKVRVTLKPDYSRNELDKWACSWQLRDYAWRLESSMYAVVVISLHSKGAVYHDLFPFTKEMAVSHKAQAEQYYGEMAKVAGADKSWLRENVNHRNEYGLCEYMVDGLCALEMTKELRDLDFVVVPRGER